MSDHDSRIVLGAYDDEAIHPTDNNWTRHSVYRIDRDLKNRTEVPLPYMIWSLNGKDKLVIDREQNVLLAVSNNDILSPYGKVIKIDRAGKIHDLYTTRNHLLPPVIGKKQRIYVAEAYSINNDKGLYFYCLDAHGLLLWEKSFSCDHIASIPVLDAHGNIYIVTDDSEGIFTLHALTNQGEEKWHWSHQGENRVEPFFGRDGSIYYATNGDISKISMDGQSEWEKSFNSMIGPPSMDINGRISFESEGYLYVLSAEGDFIHKIEVDGLFGGSYPLSLTNDIFLCEVNRCKLIALDVRTKKILWEYQSKGFQADVFPIVDSAGHIIYTTREIHPKSYVNVISKDGEKLGEYEIDGIVLSAVLGADNLLHILSQVRVRRSRKKDELPYGTKLITLRS